MKSLIIIIFCFLVCSSHVISQQSAPAGQKLLGVFDGRTPCNVLATYLNEPPRPDCIKIKWRLILFVDSMSNEPTRYELIGFTYKKENPRIGTWQILQGTYADDQAIVYHLTETGKPPLLFQSCGNSILFFLDKDRKLLVGNRDFSYTLNRKPDK